MNAPAIPSLHPIPLKVYAGLRPGLKNQLHMP